MIMKMRFQIIHKTKKNMFSVKVNSKKICLLYQDRKTLQILVNLKAINKSKLFLIIQMLTQKLLQILDEVFLKILLTII